MLYKVTGVKIDGNLMSEENYRILVEKPKRKFHFFILTDHSLHIPTSFTSAMLYTNDSGL